MLRWLERWRVVAVQDAYRTMPWADVVYGSDLKWWRTQDGCPGFSGARWSTHSLGDHVDDKREAAERWGVQLVQGEDGKGFSTNPGVIHYGSNSGYQAIQVALHKGCKRIVLVGYDMRHVDGKAHFFGDHPQGLHTNTDAQFRNYAQFFAKAAKLLPADVSIVNATPGSALTCFPMMTLEDAIASDIRFGDGGLHWYRAFANDATG